MEEKINQRIRLTKQLLKNSLVELLETESIQKISIKSLCEHAGVNRATFYKYYGSQFDLLREIEMGAVQNVISILEAHPEEKTNALLEICRYLDRNEQFMRPLITNGSEFVTMIFSHSTIQQEIKRSLSPHFRPDEMEYVFDFLASGCARLAQSWINKKDREPAEDIATLLAKLIMHSYKIHY